MTDKEKCVLELDWKEVWKVYASKIKLSHDGVINTSLVLVIEEAINNGVELTDTNGNPRGKSEVEKSIPKGGKIVLVTEVINKHVKILADLQQNGFAIEVQDAVLKEIQFEEY